VFQLIICPTDLARADGADDDFRILSIEYMLPVRIEDLDWQSKADRLIGRAFACRT
jgi:hypothetical protein